MTNAKSSTRKTIEHYFTVPNGGDMKDFGIAQHWAIQKANDLGIDTSYDDWARIESDGEGFSIVVTERKEVER